MTALRPILNASLPSAFREIRLTLAREPDRPEGDEMIKYVFIAPLSPEGKIDAELWRRHRDACRVARSRPGKPDIQGHLIHRAGGSWAFHYESIADDVGFHFQDEHFVEGEYVSVREAGKFRPFRVAQVERL